MRSYPAALPALSRWIPITAPNIAAAASRMATRAICVVARQFGG
ncbi:MAG: hypothetical protein JETT_2649 [Candidatus Jettenia ecosi]|uniref:Uncharacterized protein n=1 Tax=Candidatus Jettenia ecosi TaxID=2494326 RepID=A0A533Q8S1_9BACT|nr:MAG: hypothetical protein JETT_2649 [Candidatus Jettenia ecosi]